jgi:hypothetical protein
MQPLYLSRTEDLGHGDLVKVDCAACHHVALLTLEFLLRLETQPSDQGARPQGARPVPRMRSKGTSQQVASPNR